MSFLADMFRSFFTHVANSSSTACTVWFWDEPECPKSLIK